MSNHLKSLLTLFVFALFAAAPLGPAAAKGEKAGDFDYYVVALSWTPNWCDGDRDRLSSAQCDPAKDFGFTLHGLWPQFEAGWPSYCRTSARDPSRSQTREMTDIMGSSGLAWHQWKKHGRCSGLRASDYFKASRTAYELMARPEILRQIDRQISVAPKVIEAAFVEANPSLHPDMITVTCKRGALQEVRICLTKNLEFRTCGNDIIRDCGNVSIDFLPIR